MAGAPEAVLLKPIWYGRFQVEFFNRTGQQFDIKKYGSEPSYKKKYNTQILDSAAAADGEYQKIVASAVSLGTRRKAKILPSVLGDKIGFKGGDVDVKTTAGMLFTYMAGYNSRDFQQIVESLKSTKEIYEEQGLKNKDMAWALAIPLGSVLGLMTYGYLSQLKYVASKIIMPSDDEEEEEGKEELKLLTTKEGVFEELATGIASLAATKYNAMGRSLIKAFGSLLYNITEDEEEKKKIRLHVRNLSMQNPFDIDKYGSDKANMYESVFESVAAASIALTNIDKTIKAYGGIEPILDRIERGEPISEREKEALLLTKLSIAMFNATAQFAGGYGIPSTSVNRFIDSQVKKSVTPSVAKAKEKAIDNYVDIAGKKFKGKYVSTSDLFDEFGKTPTMSTDAVNKFKKEFDTTENPRQKVANRHNVNVLRNKGELKFTNAFVESNGTGKDFSDASDFADKYYKKISTKGISEAHKKVIQEIAPSEGYYDNFENFYKELQKQSK